MIQPQQLTNRIIATATDFVGLVEREENSHWDDPRTPYRDVDKDVWLRTWMEKISGWEPGAPYCVAFDGAVIAASLYQLGVPIAKFLRNWTAHVMTNARHMHSLGLLSSTPSRGAVWLARHGESDSGHAGIVMDVHGNSMVTIEGNTSAGPTADPQQQRQGDGIWIRTFPQGGRGDLVTQGFVSVESVLKIAA